MILCFVGDSKIRPNFKIINCKKNKREKGENKKKENHFSTKMTNFMYLA